MRLKNAHSHTPEAFEALVRALLKLPPASSDAQLLEALKSHGDLTPEWYRTRIDAIKEANANVVARNHRRTRQIH